MKLIIALVQDQDANLLIEDLSQKEYRITKLSSTGGFLKSGNTTLLIGVEDDKVAEVVRIIEHNCKKRKMTTHLLNADMEGDGFIPYPLEVEVGGATIFTLDVDDYICI